MPDTKRGRERKGKQKELQRLEEEWQRELTSQPEPPFEDEPESMLTPAEDLPGSD